MLQISAIIVAAGNSTRFAGRDKKTFVTLRGTPVWLHSANVFFRHPDVSQIVVAVSANDQDWFCRQYAEEIERLKIRVVPGGQQRSDSVQNGLAAVSPSNDLVAIHDGARPCFTVELLESVVRAAATQGAAIPAVPVASTIKRVTQANLISGTVDRSDLYLAQTPQVFRRELILTAYQNRGSSRPTDEAGLLEQQGLPVSIVAGSKFNIKITQPEDLHFAELCLQATQRS